MSIVTLRKSRLDQLVAEGSKRALAVARLRDKPERFLATVQIGITVIGATAAAFSGASIADRIALWLEPHVGAGAEELALVLVVIAVSYLTLVLGELVPKSIALHAPEPYAMLVSRPLLALSVLGRPLVWILTVSSNIVLRPFGDRTSFIESRVSVEEMQSILAEASRAGTVNPEAGEMAMRAMEFSDLWVAEVMVPRHRMTALPHDATPEALRLAFADRGHTRIPVFEGSLDKIVGFLSARDVLARSLAGQPLAIDAMLRKALFVPETMSAARTVRRMQESRTRLAMVVDEHGGIAGMVTLEDLAAEVVGAMDDRTPGHGMIADDRPGFVVVRGDAPLREVNRALRLDLEESEDWSTLSGYCTGLAGGVIPEKGAVLVSRNGTRIEVVEANPRRVVSVRLEKK